jgi:hypothetical protein
LQAIGLSQTPDQSESAFVREANSWIRRHRNGTAIALAIWLNGRCEASVYEHAGARLALDRIRYDSEDEAKAKAEELLTTAYPHECLDECEPWAPFPPLAAMGAL